LLTAVGNGALPTRPLHGYDAPSPSTGKTLGAQVPALATMGHRAPELTIGWDEAEFEKRLVGVLQAGDPIAILDNVKGRPVEGQFLDAMLTSPMVQSRILGKTGNPLLPNHCCLSATGNGLQFPDDMVPRTLLCRLNAGMERPQERHFDRDLNTWVPEHRVELVSAALTIMRAHALADYPGLPKDASRFPEWDCIVRGALIWVGERDPIASQVEIATADPVIGDLGALLVACHSHDALNKSVGFTAKELAESAAVEGPVKDAVDVLFPKGSPSVKALSMYLTGKAGRIVDSLWFATWVDEHSKVRWFRVRVTPPKAPPSARPVFSVSSILRVIAGRCGPFPTARLPIARAGLQHIHFPWSYEK
jgi:putative DNA primase/helicase